MTNLKKNAPDICGIRGTDENDTGQRYFLIYDYNTFGQEGSNTDRVRFLKAASNLHSNGGRVHHQSNLHRGEEVKRQRAAVWQSDANPTRGSLDSQTSGFLKSGVLFVPGRERVLQGKAYPGMLLKVGQS